MTEAELVKGLTELVQDRISKGYSRLGVRCETEDMEQADRSKAVRAYIVDLFGNYDEVAGLRELEQAIDKSIAMYYDKKDNMSRTIEREGDFKCCTLPFGYGTVCT